MRCCLLVALGLAIVLTGAPAAAQTWIGGRTAPVLGEIIAIDATGEPGWLYGAEDLAGDGLESFKQQEQSIDIRTAYAATSQTRLWVRTYVSDPNSAGGNITVFVFIDADQSTATGGTAAAPELSDLFTTDLSPGGYDYAVEVGGNGSIKQIWQWQDSQQLYVGTDPTAEQAEAETDQDVDPIEINGDNHGYLQCMVDLDQVGLTPECHANIYVRSINSSATGDGDLEVGNVAPCVPVDENDDGVPDLLVPVDLCTMDAQCPGGGICVNGICHVPHHCLTDDDCDPNEECFEQDVCIPRPSGGCTSNADCGDLVCLDGTCSPCTPGSGECGPGRICAPTHRCIDAGQPPDGTGGDDGGGIYFNEDTDRAQGGALTCAATRQHSSWTLLLLLGLLTVATAARRRRSQGGGRP